MITFTAAALGARKVAKKIPWKVWAFAGLVLVLSLSHYGVYRQGKSVVQQEWDASVERGKVIVDELKSRQGQITTKTVTVYKDRIKVIHEKGKTITQLIPQYIPIDALDLPGGFRLLHDAAATNAIPEAPGGVKAFPVPLAIAATTITENYSLCHVEREKLQSLWNWAQDQRQLYLELCKRPGVACSKDN